MQFDVVDLQVLSDGQGCNPWSCSVLQIVKQLAEFRAPSPSHGGGEILNGLDLG
jgi:hypothetical protein